ncbi:MAG: V-type ATP synthase subunit D [Alphaproteobacteria bacterium]
MTDPYADRTISRALLQEIRQDRSLMEEGHRFLDEMRVLLGQELLIRIARYDEAVRRMKEAQETARRALADAVLAAGLHNLQVHPAAPAEGPELSVPFDNFLGVHLPRSPEANGEGQEDRRQTAGGSREGEGDTGAQDAGDSPEVRRVREAFRAVLAEARKAALETTAILRLYREYQRADRRARALENVLMPEIRDAERRTDEALEAADLEEAVQIRLSADRSRRMRGEGSQL